MMATLAAALGPSVRPGFVVIVHPRTASTRMDRAFLAEAFLRRTTVWPDDTPIKPVDQVQDSAVRQRFSQEVLSRSVVSVRSYWQQRIFSGDGIPPPELANDQAVVTYVASHPGAIGYVAAGSSLAGVRSLDVD